MRMRAGLFTLAWTLIVLPAFAQVTVSVGPVPIAPQGCLVCATISNDTLNTVSLSSPCPLSVKTQTGVPVWNAPNCFPQTINIAPGQTFVAQWTQRDFTNTQVPQGIYRLDVTTPTGIQQFFIQIGPPEAAGMTPLGAHKLGTSRPMVICSPQSGNLPYIMAASLTTFPGLPLCPGVNLPLNIDFLFQLSLDPTNPFFQNFVGTLDASGHTVQGLDPQITIPNVPAIANFQFSMAAVVFDVNNVNCPFKVTPPYTATIIP